jgi:hypothetical protein
MKIKIDDARKLFVALSFSAAENWTAERLNKKLAKMGDLFNDPQNFDPDSIEDKSSRKLYDKIKVAFNAGEKISVASDESEEEDESEDEKSVTEAKGADDEVRDLEDEEESEDEASEETDESTEE